MKITLNNALRLNQIISNFSNSAIPFSTAYKFSKILSATQDEVTFYQEKMKQIIESYGEKDENNNYVMIDGDVKIKSDLMEQCQKEMFELISIEVDIPDVTFTPEELSTTNWSIQDMVILNKFIKE